MNSKLMGEVSCVAGRLSHNEEERYIAIMKELQFGEPFRPVNTCYTVVPTQKCSILVNIFFTVFKLFSVTYTEI